MASALIDCDETLSAAVSAALIISKGHVRLAEAMLEMTPEIVEIVLKETGH